MELVIWMNIPSHHQQYFIKGIRKKGMKLEMRYFDEVLLRERKAQGWEQVYLDNDDKFVDNTIDPLRTVKGSSNKLHIVTGYGHPVLRSVIKELIKNKYKWVHWGEPTRNGLCRIFRYPIKYWYGKCVKKYALGAFAIGSMAIADFVKWGIPREKIAFLPYTIKIRRDENVVREEPVDKLKFIFLGVLCRRKGIDILLKSVREIASDCKGMKWELNIIGKDYTGGKSQKIVERYGLIEKVIIHDGVSSNAISQCLQNNHVLILPSRFDGWGVVVNEAISLGLAVIASDKVGAAKHLVDPLGNGFIVKTGCSSSLARAMMAYIKSPMLAKRHGEVSKRISRNYTPERHVERFIGILDTMVARIE